MARVSQPNTIFFAIHIARAKSRKFMFGIPLRESSPDSILAQPGATMAEPHCAPDRRRPGCAGQALAASIVTVSFVGMGDPNAHLCT